MSATPTAMTPPPPDGVTCGYVGCAEPATHVMRSKYAHLWWSGCGDHWKTMHTALFLGQPAESGSVDLRRVGAA